MPHTSTPVPRGAARHAPGVQWRPEELADAAGQRGPFGRLARAAAHARRCPAA